MYSSRVFENHTRPLKANTTDLYETLLLECATFEHTLKSHREKRKHVRWVDDCLLLYSIDPAQVL